LGKPQNRTKSHRDWRNVVFLLISLACFYIAVTSIQTFNELYANANNGHDVLTDAFGNVIAFATLGSQALAVAGIAAITGLVFMLLAIFLKRKRR
jgi:uncharacterized protein YacL